MLVGLAVGFSEGKGGCVFPMIEELYGGGGEIADDGGIIDVGRGGALVGGGGRECRG